jgi:hypothetical protein
MGIYVEPPYQIGADGALRWTRRGTSLPPPLASRPARAALANRDNAPFKVMVCGTSVSEGTGPPGPFTNRWIYRFQTFLRGAFPTAGVKGGVGYVPAYFEGGQPDAPTTVNLTANTGGTSVADKRPEHGLGGRAYGLKYGARVSWTYECTSARIFYSKSSFSTSGTVWIDGVQVATLSGNNATAVSGFVWDSGQLEPGVHTVEVRAGSDGFYIIVEGVHFHYRDETKGIWVIDSSKNGATAYLPTMNTSNMGSVTTYAPDVIVTEYMTNDYLYNNAGTAAYYTDLTNWVNRAITAQGSKQFTMLFMINPQPNASPVATHGETWEAYCAVVRRVASDFAAHATMKPLVIDWRDYMGPTVAPDQGASGLGLWFDPAHLSIKGNAFVSDLMATALGAIGGGKVEPDVSVIRIPAESGNVGASPAGELNLFARSHGGRIMPRFTDPIALDFTVQPHVGMNNIRFVAPASGTTAATVYSATGTSVTAVGGTGATFANPTPASTNLLTSTRRVQMLTGATINTIISVRENVQHIWRGNAAGLGGFHFIARFGHEARVPERVFVGVQEGVAAPTNIDPLTATTLSKIGMAHSASTGNWRLIHHNAGTAPTTIDLGSSFPVDTTNLLELQLFCAPNGSTVGYRVSLLSSPAVTVSGTLSTNLPAATTFMSMMAWAVNTTAVTATLSIARLYLESDN